MEKIKLNTIDYKYRQENNEQLLVYDVINAKMFFFKGNTKKYIESLLYNKDINIQLSKDYLNYLINNNILIRKDN